MLGLEVHRKQWLFLVNWSVKGSLLLHNVIAEYLKLPPQELLQDKSHWPALPFSYNNLHSKIIHIEPQSI
ncbi:hypothetical protein N7466_001735 [Penicillium verhagenii]|uniref:uncharacterized protein n=1 Tax=Penicillium verhagenii TaxID=1562060 RepID=UPI002545385F|nr:uncharacterized protein N7466_001735 [Penicillium verhagenii]KAJ5938601.1 hypothetical protein N7466_001735 [Penicillium verhagenii]